VEPDDLDQAADLRLRRAEEDGTPARSQAPREHGQIEHQRCVGERQAAQVDDNVTLRPQGPDKSRSAESLRHPVLVSTAAQCRGLLLEVDDGGNLANSRQPCQCNTELLPMQDGGCVPARLVAMVSVDDVTEALRDVIDPELGLDFVELGLIYDVEVEDPGSVKVTYTLTSPGCPIGPQVAEQIEEFVGELDGVVDVQSTMTFSPPWTPELMSEDAKFALGF
jgi:metal-sulfur cluster biosynthetic enzyme